MRFTKKVVTALVALALMLMPVTALASSQDITVTIDGVAVEFYDQSPVIVGSSTLVPARFVFEDLGFSVTWDSGAGTATLTRSDYVVVIVIGSDTFTTNDVSYNFEVPAQIIGGRTMIPLRAVLESIGYVVGWDGATRTVIITTEVTDEPTPPAEDEPVNEDEPVDEPIDEPETEDEPENEDEGLEAFLSHFDLDAVRELLGVDFEVGAEEHTRNVPAGEQQFRFLIFDGELNDLGDADAIMFDGAELSSYGDVFLLLHADGSTLLFIDMGYTYDLTPDLAWEHMPENARATARSYIRIILEDIASR